MRYRVTQVCVVFGMVASAWAAPPLACSVETALGPKSYRDGDVIEITDVRATSPRLEQGDTVIVQGKVRLDSQSTGQLCLFLTQTAGDGMEETEAMQTMTAKSISPR